MNAPMLGSVRLERSDQSGSGGWAVAITRPGRSPLHRTFPDGAAAMTFAAQAAAMHDLPLVRVRAETTDG